MTALPTYAGLVEDPEREDDERGYEEEPEAAAAFAQEVHVAIDAIAAGTVPFVAYGCDWCGQGDHDPTEPQEDWDLKLDGFEVWGETCHCGAPMREVGGQWVCQDPYCGASKQGLPGVLSPVMAGGSL
ncbi:hypothetical protein [Streptomyces rhizosphaericus]|uniref:Uncharacterized protein n=1 Tax=Streptomyces rhizosphaericus TaxID=114699 RepID=A0A6G4AY30_9ACTN|nr:hypothetical protein [Streptomyces rhizosphaericus]NEW77654.1 hypothetical protein [Streptomyces rhizosphaericus]